MARPANRQETRTFEVTVPIALYEYLSYLATHTTLGASENAVAVYLIGRAVEEMIRSDFHSRMAPRIHGGVGSD